MIRRICIDMDGVIADFQTGIRCAHGIKEDPYDKPESIGVWATWHLMEMTEDEFYAPCDHAFWCGLPLYPMAKQLVSECCRLAEVFIVSTPPPNKYSWPAMTGKRAWVQEHFPWLPQQNIIISPNKWHYSDRESLLIDDSDANCDMWVEQGHVIRVPRKWNRLYERSPASDVCVLNCLQNAFHKKGAS